VIATKKGVNALERGSQVHFMAEFQELLDFPPAPKLGITGRLTARASEAHGGVFQPRPRIEIDRRGEGGPGGVHARPIGHLAPGKVPAHAYQIRVAIATRG
jgi:hypothetical protein